MVGANNQQADKIDVSPAGANGDKQLADGKSADKALIQYAQAPSATVDLYLAGTTCVFENGRAEMDKVPLVDGSVTVPFYSRTSEYVTLTAYLTTDRKVYGSHDFFFSPAVKKVDLQAVPGCDTAPPDGVTPDKVTATVYGYDDGRVAHIPVTFTPRPQATLTPAQPEKTKSDGTATVSITNTVPGDVVMTATAGGVTSAPVPVTFTQAPSPTVASISMLPVPLTAGAAADGVAAIEVTAIVLGPDRQAVADGTAVAFTDDPFANVGGTTTIDTPTAQTKNGHATTTVRSTVKGWRTITASAGGKSGATTVYFGYGQFVLLVDLYVNPDNQSYRGMGTDVVWATAYLDLEKKIRAPKGVLLEFVDLSLGKLSVATADGNPPATNDLGLVVWNVRCGEAGEFPFKVVADNGVPAYATVSFQPG